MPSARSFIIFPFVFALFIAFTSSLYGKDFRILERDRVRIHYPDTAEQAATELLEIYPTLTAELEETLGWEFHTQSTVVLFSNRDRFERAAGSSYILAFAVPSKQLIVMDMSRLRDPSFDPRLTLKHEICHLVLHHHISQVHLPKWLDEGICQWVSGGFSDMLMVQKQSRLNRVVLSGNLIPLELLSKRFPQDREGMQLAYEESRSFVEYIIKRFGKQGLLSVLAGMKKGKNVHTAVLGALAVPFSSLENEWRGYLQEKVTWFTYLSYHIYDIVFGLTAVLLVAASVRIFFRKRAAYKEEWESLDD